MQNQKVAMKETVMNTLQINCSEELTINQSINYVSTRLTNVYILHVNKT